MNAYSKILLNLIFNHIQYSVIFGLEIIQKCFCYNLNNLYVLSWALTKIHTKAVYHSVYIRYATIYFNYISISIIYIF